MAKKTFLLDTSVYLTDAQAIYSYGFHDIIIPLKVLEEIDKHKKRQDGVGSNARSIIRTFDGLRERGNLNKGVRIRKGKGIAYAKTFDVEDLPVRFRPSYFPFTEPSAEVDIGCSREDGGLTIGGGASWLEILGCGMVNPHVLENCGIDSTKYQGFAFGMGIERAAMLKYGIPDLRTFYESDIRWLKHYGFVPLDIPNVAVGLVR